MRKITSAAGQVLYMHEACCMHSKLLHEPCCPVHGELCLPWGAIYHTSPAVVPIQQAHWLCCLPYPEWNRQKACLRTQSYRASLQRPRYRLAQDKPVGSILVQPGVAIQQTQLVRDGGDLVVFLIRKRPVRGVVNVALHSNSALTGTAVKVLHCSFGAQIFVWLLVLCVTISGC